MNSAIRGSAHRLALAIFSIGVLGPAYEACAAPPPTSLSLPQAPASSGSETAPLPAAPQAAPQSAPASGTNQAAPSGGQNGDDPAALRAAYDAAFQATLQNPADPQVLVKFAEVAVKYGDIEGAISALERLLLVDDDQPEVKLELGVLYFRLGSKEAARMYLDAARSSAQASPETKEQAERYLKADGVK